MIAIEIISHDIPPLKITDTGIKALTWMEEFKVSHLPIVDNKEYLGLVTDADILDMNAPDESVDSGKISLARPFVYEHDHIYEILKVINKLNLTVLPVVDREEAFVGLITLPSLVKAIGDMAAVKDPGGVIILEMNQHDYHLGEISRLVEGNDAKILSCHITSLSDSTMLEVTLKINRTDLSPILQTFNRFNYNIKASFHQGGFVDEMKDRYDSFMNYLNI
jgi:acetoin utilization protein AcuB